MRRPDRNSAYSLPHNADDGQEACRHIRPIPWDGAVVGEVDATNRRRTPTARRQVRDDDAWERA